MSPPTRTTKRSRSTKPRKIATPKRSRKGKRAPKKKAAKRKPAKKAAKRKPAKKSAKRGAKKKSSRSKSASKAWRKRKMRAKLIDMMHASGWREVGLPTKDDLHKWLEWGGERLGVDIGDMYRMYWGSPTDEPALEVWEQ